ncbi:protein of unknown function (plasmid) [Azospirillum baldaniorum]|uniref:Uncharacterized protein n=1 Tax=Azospirillum baldaniorum TaxID=1064539 RepID=A0A9P1NR80_9PROT|nr:protein of unknown function [Azospirillum baldaniorum]
MSSGKPSSTLSPTQRIPGESAWTTNVRL